MACKHNLRSLLQVHQCFEKETITDAQQSTVNKYYNLPYLLPYPLNLALSVVDPTVRENDERFK